MTAIENEMTEQPAIAGQILPQEGDNSDQAESEPAEGIATAGEPEQDNQDYWHFRLDLDKATDSEKALAAYDNETRQMIDAANEKVFDLQDEYEDLKDEAAKAKKAYEAADEDMRKMIRDRRLNRGKPQQPQLFDGSQTGERELHSEGLTDSPDKDLPPDEWTPKIASEEKEDETWKLVTLRDMVINDGLNQKAAEILEANGLDTLGKVTNYTAPSVSGWCASLTDFKGFGPKKVEQWQDACENFWKRWPNELRARSQNTGTSEESDGGESSSDRGSEEDKDEFVPLCGICNDPEDECKCGQEE